MTEERDRVIHSLRTLVSCESPSKEPELLRQIIAVANDLGTEYLGVAGQVIERDNNPCVLWQFGDHIDVLILCHLDTVWPKGTIDRWPFALEGDRATGPGIFDMKAGVIVALTALEGLSNLDGVTILMNTDEEIGTLYSRPLIEELALQAKVVLVFEPSVEGKLKIARKGVSFYNVDFHGRASHAGLDPYTGVSGISGLAHWLIEAERLGSRERGTTVTPTLMSGGSAQNVVPEHSTVMFDVRVETAAEQARVDEEIRAIPSPLAGLSVTVSGGPNRGPLERVRSERLFALVNEVARAKGLPALEGEAVGGGSDGNLTANLGIDTLDGMGAVGEHAHAEGEWASIDMILERAAIARALLEHLLSSTPVAADSSTK